MNDEFLIEQATHYASGNMSAAERLRFELMLEFHEPLRGLSNALGDIGAALTLAGAARAAAWPVPALKQRIQDAIGSRPQQRTADGLVMAGPDALVQWINLAFSAMCGYSIEELRGKRLGPILQGAGTDSQAVQRMRLALGEARGCRETLLNYHKSGAAYWVEIEITPIHDDAGQLRWLVARERELAPG